MQFELGGPLGGEQRLLGGNGIRHRVRRMVEDELEGVAFRGDLKAIVPAEQPPHDSIMNVDCFIHDLQKTLLCI